jgi:hypothetical protein
MKKKAVTPAVIPVDADELSRGLRMAFEGMSMVFNSLGTGCRISGEMEAGQTEAGQTEAGQTEQTITGQTKAGQGATEQETQPDENSAETGAEASTEAAVEKTAEVSAPAAPAKPASPASSVALDDITKIIVKKIKKDRSSNQKIGSILKTYGVAKVSELPAEKYEAFLTDLAAI